MEALSHVSFFQDADVLDALATFVVPWAVTQAHFKVWDAGCATGEETLSLAAVLADQLPPERLEILATDREKGLLRAPSINGRFPALGSKAPGWFLPFPFDKGPGIPESRPDCVRYLRHDLLASESLGGGFALIVCRNVLMHLPPSLQSSLVETFHRALRPGGFLILDCFQTLPESNAGQFEHVDSRAQLFRRRPEGA